MQVVNNVISRDGHYFHEGKPSEYDQVRELYKRVLSAEERNNLHHNTARLLAVSMSTLKYDTILTYEFVARRQHSPEELPHSTMRYIGLLRQSHL